MCDFSDAYIVVKWIIDLLADAANENDKEKKDVASRNNAPFRLCILKIKCTLIESAEDLDRVMLMYNLLEYCHNYFMRSRILLMIVLQIVNQLSVKQKY